ncbi:SpoIIE family protein phosphatase [Streptomyces hainanensis]|uniref:protein-serine/threonine phosphatase n=1 Tax=Streptomyces hainanensis TaxID=402648 RepID=A0A4R4TA79_9ACTN|nr:SpoIIE family protein phosphatase [Streptomyces hainanensis]TDC71653.1 GAF domain-containing protein [Streptomyces hainanensis]
MFILQVVITLLLVAAGVTALVLDRRDEKKAAASERALVVAQTFAASPGIVEALRSDDPTAVLQPSAEAARKSTGVDFVVVMNRKGIRYTHPNPKEIGKRFIGTFEPAADGHVVREAAEGTLGLSERAVVPVRDEDGQVIAMVAAGQTQRKINLQVTSELPLLLGSTGVALALAIGGAALVSRRLQRQTRGLGPREITRLYELHDAVLHSAREGVLILDEDRRLLLANEEARRLLDLPAEAVGRDVGDLGLDEATVALLGGDEDLTDEVHPAGGRLLAVNLRRTADHGGPPGTVATLRDTTEIQALSGRAETAQRRLGLLYAASVRIGTTLEITRTAEELVEVAVPEFADYVSVDLADNVLRGEEAPGVDIQIRRIAAGGITRDHPLYPSGRSLALRPDQAEVSGLRGGRAALETDLRGTDWWRAGDEEHARRLLDLGMHSLISTPLQARGVVLGVANFWRSREDGPFDEQDLALAEELATRTAVCVDNARRYTREHEMAATLQRSLLPRDLPDQTAVRAAYRYRPAEAVGGDFFDVIPLSGARVALVVGDVVGHGLHAAATMGRLRTAVHNFAALDLPPDELLGHLDELADRVDRDEAGTDGATGTITGATCLYAIYDPVDGTCTMARAGHLPPALILPDLSVTFAELPAQPPLGVGGMPFETAELRLPAGSGLVLYTDGLVEARHRDIDRGLGMLAEALHHSAERDEDPETMCDAVLDDLLPPRPGDDVALLVARTRMLSSEQVAVWEVPATPSAVAPIRAAVSERLTEWGLSEMAFITELILTELITNAIRHAAGPVRVRVLRDRALICEVSDASSTSPHLRNATATDEGGRGLFLVAQYADRWGTRYTPSGKIIWAEQRLPLRR